MADTQTDIEDSPQQPEDFVWVTRLGEPIRFVDMGRRHLANTRGFIDKRLADLQSARDQQAMDQNIFGDNPEGFTGFEARIDYMKTALDLATKEINRRVARESS